MTITREVHDNWYTPISFKQFQSLSSTFLEKAKKSLGTEEIVVETATYTNYKLEISDIARLDMAGLVKDTEKALKDRKAYNESIISKRTKNISQITQDEFEKAASISILVRPKNPSEERPNARAWATFKDHSPYRATLVTM